MSAHRGVRLGARALRLLTWFWPGDLRGAVPAWEDTVTRTLSAARSRSGPGGLIGRFFFELTDVLRLAAPRRVALPMAALGLAVASAVLVFPERGLVTQYGSLEVRAEDPAGEFTLTFDHGVLVGATVDRARIPADRLRQRGDSIWLLDSAGGALVAAEFVAPGLVRWQPREPRSL